MEKNNLAVAIKIKNTYILYVHVWESAPHHFSDLMAHVELQHLPWKQSMTIDPKKSEHGWHSPDHHEMDGHVTYTGLIQVNLRAFSGNAGTNMLLSVDSNLEGLIPVAAKSCFVAAKSRFETVRSMAMEKPHSERN